MLNRASIDVHNAFPSTDVKALYVVRNSGCGLLYTNSIAILCITVVTKATPYHKHDHLLTRFVQERNFIVPYFSL